jgi:hypothetical protein
MEGIFLEPTWYHRGVQAMNPGTRTSLPGNPTDAAPRTHQTTASLDQQKSPQPLAPPHQPQGGAAAASKRLRTKKPHHLPILHIMVWNARGLSDETTALVMLDHITTEFPQVDVVVLSAGG